MSSRLFVFQVKRPMEHALAVRRGQMLAIAVSEAEEAPPEAEEAPPLKDTIRAVARGNREAFSRLYAAYARMIRAILLGRVPSCDVDDLLQDVFLTAYTRIRELRNPDAFGGWLAAIARNRAADHMRQSKDHAALPLELPGGDAIETETLEALDAVRRLPEAYRETLLMRLVEGMTGDEIAQRTGLTPASVRVNLHRGMKLLRKKLGYE